METEKIKHLLDKYFEGETSLEEEQLLRDYFQDEAIPPDLQSYREQFLYAAEFNNTKPGEAFNAFEKIDFKGAQKSPLKKGEGIAPDDSRGLSKTKSEDSIKNWTLRIAAGFLLLIIGFAAGRFLNDTNHASTQQVARLEQDVQQMKEALMNTGMYQNASAGERLSAVHISSRVPGNNQKLDRQITDILIHTMNNDESVNVRLAATEALFKFRAEPGVKQALVKSLALQNDPLMQVTLIDMLVDLKAQTAINEMKKLLVNSSTQNVVRQHLEAGIAQLQV